MNNLILEQFNKIFPPNIDICVVLVLEVCLSKGHMYMKILIEVLKQLFNPFFRLLHIKNTDEYYCRETLEKTGNINEAFEQGSKFISDHNKVGYIVYFIRSLFFMAIVLFLFTHFIVH